MPGQITSYAKSIEEIAEGLLRFEVSETISQPSVIQTDDTYLFWSIKDYNHLGEWFSKFEERDVKGCLQDFLQLAKDAPEEKASPEEILAFARRRGVLGIYPYVKTDGEFRYYAEPLALYSYFADRAKMIISLARVIRDGRPLEETYRLGKKFALDNYSRAYAYRYLHLMVYNWWKVNTFRMVFPVPTPSEAEYKITPEITFKLDFGNWWTGKTWDERATENQPYYSFPVPNSGSELDPEFIMPLPEDQRPSPLFNVLAYQLLQVAKLPPGYHFCEECQIPFEWEGKRSKPRSDKPIRCDECKEIVKKRLNAAAKKRARTALSALGTPAPVSHCRRLACD